MSRIKVHPARRPNLSKAGLLTFMSSSGHGLAGLAKTCPTPTCQCRDILLDLVHIDFRVESVALTKGKLSFRTKQLGGLEPAGDTASWIAARLNPDTGELLVEPERTQSPEADAHLAPLRDALDGDLLDDFSRLWRRLKAQPHVSDEPLRDADLDDWKPGETLAFGQIFEELRADGYPVGDKIYEVVDLYCPDPSCDCCEVIVIFIDPTGSDKYAGTATVDLSTGQVSFDHDTDDETLVPGLWRRFVHRHRGVKVLFDRQQRMKDYGEVLFERQVQQPEVLDPLPAPLENATDGQRRAGTKIGRNETCPCGSGKKYKKCCLPRRSP